MSKATRDASAGTGAEPSNSDAMLQLADVLSQRGGTAAKEAPKFAIF